jgi:hypothetical protein
VVHADPAPNPVAETFVPPAGPTVAGVEDWRRFGWSLDHRATKARVNSNVNEASAEAENSRRFSEDRRWVIKVCVSQHGHDRVERTVGERELGRVCLDEPCAHGPSAIRRDR